MRHLQVPCEATEDQELVCPQCAAMLLTLSVTCHLHARYRCNVQVSMIDSSQFIIHTIMLLCQYDVIKKCSRDTKHCTL